MKRPMLTLRYILNSLYRTPGFVCMVVLTLGLAIGANTTVFSVVHGVLIKQLPFEEPDRIVQLREHMVERDQLTMVSPLNALDYAESDVFESLGIFQWTGLAYGGSDRPRDITGLWVTPDLGRALGVKPVLGRDFSADDLEHKRILISHGFWQNQLGGREDVLDSEILLDNEPNTIIGVLPPTLNYPGSQITFWRASKHFYEMDNRRSRYLWVIGRLRPDLSVEAANAQLATLARSLAETYPEENEGYSVQALPLKSQIVDDIEDSLWILMAIVGFVMLIACANVANMLLSRGVSRARELAIRTAVGADRRDLIGLMLAESALLALAGAGFGLLLAFAAMDLVGKLEVLDLPRLDEVGINGPVLAFNLGVAVVSTLIFGLIPALKSSQIDIADALKSGGKGLASAGSNRVRQAFSIASVALSLVLVVVSFLLVRSFITLQTVDPGFQPENTAAAQLWRNSDQEERAAFRQAVLARAAEHPAVQTAGFTSSLPMDFIGTGSSELIVHGRDEPESRMSRVILVQGDYLQTMGVPLILGEPLDARFDSAKEKVIWLSQAAVEAYFPGADPIGQLIRFDDHQHRQDESQYENKPGGSTRPDNAYRIAGVVGDIRHDALQDDPLPTVYIPHHLTGHVGTNLVIRGRTSREHLLEAVQDLVWQIDPAQPIYRDISPEALLEDSLADERVYLQLVLIFTAVAVILSSIGIYSVMSYSVSQRQTEFGLRAALGASAGQILAMVIRQGAVRIAIGLGIGLVITVVIARGLQSQLYAISAMDPLTLAVAALGLALVGLVACVLPARRAVRIDPMQALRFE